MHGSQQEVDMKKRALVILLTPIALSNVGLCDPEILQKGKVLNTKELDRRARSRGARNRSACL